MNHSTPLESISSENKRRQKNNLAVFAKYWQPGKVKTRLGAEIGNENSAFLFHNMLQTLLNRLSPLTDIEITLYFSPPEQKEEFYSLPGDWKLVPQPPGGLDQRSKSYFRDALQQYDKVVIIGGDSPHISLSEVEKAFQRLEQYPMVIGPAIDGGYYLLGLTEPAEYLFENIDWSSSRVLTQTLAQAECHDLRYSLLAPAYDLDELPQLIEFAAQYSQSTDQKLANLASQIRRLLPNSSRTLGQARHRQLKNE